jgi:hypothetical protein
MRLLTTRGLYLGGFSENYVRYQQLHKKRYSSMSKFASTPEKPSGQGQGSSGSVHATKGKEAVAARQESVMTFVCRNRGICSHTPAATRLTLFFLLY